MGIFHIGDEEMANHTQDEFAMSVDDWTAVAIVGGLAIIGLAANGFAMLILYKGGKISNAFQQLCFSHSFANFFALLFFLFYCTPAIILKTDFTNKNPVGKLIGGFMVMLWDVSVYSHLCGAINRMIVISWPVKSREFMTKRVSCGMILTVWIISFLHYIPYFWVNDCYIAFYPTVYLWDFSNNECGFILGKWLDFGTGVTVFALILLADILTLYRIRLLLKQVGLKRSHTRRDIKFFIQTCLQFLVFVVKLTCFYFISENFMGDEKYHWPLFFTTSFAWECATTVDGLIIIPFHVGDYLNRHKKGPLTTIFQSQMNSQVGSLSRPASVMRMEIRSNASVKQSRMY
ncbi:hypothetical protein WR25_15463 [Diploscapter pachys]|uniref:G-protein coupled receptors family 1 profile domain-containing protein n=1 Tax=Diploscapter pachys TaxID=2018661 RepID=A0A2A2KXD3_9BILA|nr:hypothetical protein WR25_15463 [Diploscapter pachys]